MNWIPIKNKEELDKFYNENLLVYIENLDPPIQLLCYYRKKWQWMDGDDLDDSMNITHFMPLPEKP